MQDCDLAVRELQRCVKELGFKGALVNGFSNAGDMETWDDLFIQYAKQ